MGGYDCFESSCLAPTIGVAPQTFASALQFFTAAQCFIDIPTIPEAYLCDFEEFDFIIIGAGGAGCPLANRLSEIRHWKILLIEAGDDPPVESYIPGFSKNFYRTKYDWNYQSIDNRNTSQAIKDGSTYLPRGKMVGGSTGINAMFYIRGVKSDYQKWYDLGNLDWSPSVVEKYFHKLENLQNQELLNNHTISANYGHDGPVIVNKFNNSYGYINDNIFRSWEEIGIPNVLDINTAGGGSGKTTVTASNGRRRSASTIYLPPEVVNRPNLSIIKNALATKIMINRETKTAYGVEVDHKGVKKTFYAKREVILSAGAINSPQLLLLSGVGPKEELEAHNIECIYDSPAVGKNMEDHITINVPVFSNYPGERNQADAHFDVIKYLYNRTGYLAQGAFSDVLTFFPLSEETHPEFEVLVSLYWKNSTTLHDTLSAQYRYKQEVLDSFVVPNEKYALYVFTVIVLHPISTGSVFLKSNNPKDKPLFDSNFYSVPEDLPKIAQGLKKVAEIVNAKYYKSNGAFLGRINWKDCNDYELNSDEYWECIALHTGVTDYHNVGTCRMGPDPSTSVVASDLKVHGINNLRVIDAGVMPGQLSANPMATVYMIAERCSDLIKQYHGELE
ncbi:hypothetical protein O3G_MSEX003819 [Manduca sexta]|uniref:Glucose-methanol-choline oxidoreductase N-terminal domain-containing protein n=1 Tax=Manduca sexta TaxID=7130 RepID=A0A921YTE6_MANSE|nr:hypothetical protein O3G_MSEX003819 [Manduca sexta]